VKLLPNRQLLPDAFNSPLHASLGAAKPERYMTTKRREQMFAKKAVFILTLLTLAPTSSFGQEQCTPSTLKGQYVFTGRGFIEALDPGVQRMHYGVFIFDGAGKFTGKQSSSRGGKIGREKLAGTYTLDADCSGTMTFGSYVNPSAQIHWDVYVTGDGKRGHMVRMDEGNMAVRSFEK
jgi:hypothetical protein